MLTTSDDHKVLVTGASGFIAVWVVQTLLKRGYAVRGSVRSKGKGEYLRKLFERYEKKFEYVIVPDMTKDRAFDDAVKGVEAVAHTASPVPDFEVQDENNDVVETALKGTKAVIQSIIDHGSAVKHVIFLSSTAAINELGMPQKVYNEEDRNEKTVYDWNAHGLKLPMMFRYMASKALAEKAVWDIYKSIESTVPWKLTVLNPPFVFGPIMHQVESFQLLNTTSSMWYKYVMKADTFTKEELAVSGTAFVDVRDLAEAHALVFEKKEACGKRIIVSAEPFLWQDFVNVSRGLPHFRDDSKHDILIDNARSKEILGIEYRSIQVTTTDTIASFKDRGW